MNILAALQKLLGGGQKLPSGAKPAPNNALTQLLQPQVPIHATQPLPGRFQGVQPTAYGQQRIMGVRPFLPSLDNYPLNTSDPMNFGPQGYMQNMSPLDDTQHAIPPGFFSQGNTFPASNIGYRNPFQ